MRLYYVQFTLNGCTRPIFSGLVRAVQYAPISNSIGRMSSNEATEWRQFQGRLYKAALVEADTFSLKTFLAQRYARKLGTSADAHVERSLILIISFKTKPAWLSAVVKTCVDGWCTPANFGQPLAMCSFCKQDEADELSHFASCPALLEVAERWYSADWPSIDMHFCPDRC